MRTSHTPRISPTNEMSDITNANIPKFTSAHELLIEKFPIEIEVSNKFNKRRRNIIKKIELTKGDKLCIVKSDRNSVLICDTIVRGILPKRHGGLESPSVFVLVADNKFDFYTITELAENKYHILDRVLQNVIVKRVFTIYQLADFIISDLKEDITKKYKSKLVVITGDFFMSDPQIDKEEKDWLYPQMIEAIKKITNSIVLLFSPINLPL